MSRFIEAAAPPIREDGLPHDVKVRGNVWACQMDCPSCVAAGYYLHGLVAAGVSGDAEENR